MVCPKCNGDVKAIDNVDNPKENEIYRARKCINCGHIFYTVEYEVIQNQRFAVDWAANHRFHTKPRKEKKKENEND